VYLSPQKLNHISRFVQLPDIQLSSKLPPLLVVNVQVSHKYTKDNALFHGESFVYSPFVHRLSNSSKIWSICLFIHATSFFSHWCSICPIVTLADTCHLVVKWTCQLALNIFRCVLAVVDAYF